ncbi:MAG: transglycosylase SLT domain-containing protein, partial [Acidobacteriota bacterium]|nr:transglycosylase SLT domain-containing protein [Acidobacteriota bacterium]
GGMWQFLKWRGNEYGLKQTAFSDDRMDPEMATRAAARHLHDLYQEFGDWYLAIAAYNCGPMVVEKAVERTGYADFWELRARGVLPAETTNYVPIILAMTIMEKNAAEYGIEGFQMDPSVEYDTVETRGVTSLALVSDILDVPSTELADMNPSSLRGMVPDAYPLHVPKGTADQLMAVMQRIPSNHLDAWRVHSVSSGETLPEIGRRFNVSAANIAAVNQLENAQPQEGDRLLIPAAPRPEPAVRKPVRRSSRTATASHRTATPSRGTAARKTSQSAAARTRTARPSAIVARSTN